MEFKLFITEEDILTNTNDYDLGKIIREKFWNLKEEALYLSEVEYEHCMICGKLSPYTINTPNEDRIGYVEGSGQSCYQSNKCDKI
jgi:hypothetical protein